MDFSYPIKSGLFVVPGNFRWIGLSTKKEHVDRYSFIAIGQEAEGILGFFDGINERGFAAAALYFAGYADYDLPPLGKEPIAAIDFLHYILGRCASVDDLPVLLKDIRIVGVEDPVTKSAAPLHWIAVDRRGKCVTIEQTKNGLKIINNPIGVLSNSPDFDWHLTNLRNYMEVKTTQQQEVTWGNVSLTPFGQGGGTGHLPGGFTSPDRFVRTAFIKTHVPTPKSRFEAIMTCFHIVNSVFIPKGIVVSERGTDNYTKYIAFINTNTCEYYFKTYDNHLIRTANLHDFQNSSEQLIFLGNLD